MFYAAVMSIYGMTMVMFYQKLRRHGRYMPQFQAEPYQLKISYENAKITIEKTPIKRNFVNY